MLMPFDFWKPALSILLPCHSHPDKVSQYYGCPGSLSLHLLWAVWKNHNSLPVLWFQDLDSGPIGIKNMKKDTQQQTPWCILNTCSVDAGTSFLSRLHVHTGVSRPNGGARIILVRDAPLTPGKKKPHWLCNDRRSTYKCKPSCTAV